MTTAKAGTRQEKINKMTPAAAKAKLGDTVAELVAQINALTASHNSLLAKLDTAGATVTGLGTNYNSTLAVPSTALKTLEQR